MSSRIAHHLPWLALVLSCCATESTSDSKDAPRAETAFPGWKQYAVHQRHPRTGCIPTNYEMLLRAAGVTGIDYSTFQEDFDLGAGNDFGSVARAVHERYPHVRFAQRDFPRGADKLAFVERRIANRQPTVVSIALKGLDPTRSGWHIMAVVDADEENLYLLNWVSEDGAADVLKMAKADFVRIHDECEGGSDVAFLER